MKFVLQNEVATVRFGNVLGTTAADPHLQGQLKKGGPLTVTHPASRFFMLIPEAVHGFLIAGIG